jgi:hypothetical protein
MCLQCPQIIASGTETEGMQLGGSTYASCRTHCMPPCAWLGACVSDGLKAALTATSRGHRMDILLVPAVSEGGLGGGGESNAACTALGESRTTNATTTTSRNPQSSCSDACAKEVCVCVCVCARACVVCPSRSQIPLQTANAVSHTPPAHAFSAIIHATTNIHTISNKDIRIMNGLPAHSTLWPLDTESRSAEAEDERNDQEPEFKDGRAACIMLTTLQRQTARGKRLVACYSCMRP